MSNIIHFRPAEEHKIRFEKRMEKAIQMAIEVVHGSGVVVNNVVYTIDDVVTYLTTDQENREELVSLLTSLLNAKFGDEVDNGVRRLNRFLINGTRELAFQLAGDALKAPLGKGA
ncbi:hypothetical protein GZ77_20655 [Endozoicomonas montiporae]|uniref:Uncharacterized protein n=2 Tax=Endozoicomonas montiporae TaxID=1027273 RepID=A0A081N332_9GAMM|nr:hypothetical protein [Endozoicomonas montiporae]AMO58148.1 hypothetical protein EZMO1_4225 [Endozoicomonas montiporae CL-33]KEQ12855.1 hypothetical protein GZ77_20655 [Endozoicomonas montiporae]